MVEWRIDPRNPGEVLACAGVAHLAWRADREVETGFVMDKDARVRFVAPDLPVLRGGPEEMRLIAAAETSQGLRLGGIELDWWSPWGLNPNLKNWAGKQSAWTVHRSLRRAAGDSSPSEWLTYAAPAAGRLYLDPAGTWNALSLGWSVNEHPELRMSCRPWVELLASIGLQTFPVPSDRARAEFAYNLWRPAPLPLAVAAFGGPWSRAYALQRYHVATGKTGPNTILRRATLSENGGASAAAP